MKYVYHLELKRIKSHNPELNQEWRIMDIYASAPTTDEVIKRLESIRHQYDGDSWNFKNISWFIKQVELDGVPFVNDDALQFTRRWKDYYGGIDRGNAQITRYEVIDNGEQVESYSH